MRLDNLTSKQPGAILFFRVKGHHVTKARESHEGPRVKWGTFIAEIKQIRSGHATFTVVECAFNQTLLLTLFIDYFFHLVLFWCVNLMQFSNCTRKISDTRRFIIIFLHRSSIDVHRCKRVSLVFKFVLNLVLVVININTLLNVVQLVYLIYVTDKNITGCKNIPKLK